jgi:superfamily II DNA or RNA helicase
MELNNIKSFKALALLNKYEGKNPYLRKLREQHLKSGVILTTTQVNYICDYHDKEPHLINRVITITDYLAESLKKDHKLPFLPQRILFQFILAESDNAYHVYGKLTQKQKHSSMYWIPKTQVLDDPYWLEPTIEVDFEKYVTMDIKGRRPYGHQETGVKFLLTRNGCILADDMGLGKCLSINELAYTPNGKVKMGDLKVGDYVIGSNGKKTKVLEVHPQPKKELFKITFNDGYSTVCCKEHMWTVTSNNGSVNNKNREVRYTNLTIEQMLDEELVVEQPGTGWNQKRPYKFKTYYKQSNGQNKWQIPIVKPIQFENEYNLPIEPYLLGVSLGDGHINKNGAIKIELHKDDFDEFFDNQIINETSSVDNKRSNSINILKEEIISLKLNGTLSHTKFIPEVYKYASVEDRIAILQGLMDTDGYCMKSDNGVFVGTEYCTVSEQLADDVAEIVHSLGGIVRKKSKVGSYKDKEGDRVECKKVYRLNIKFSNDINPFRLKRKADEYNPPQKYGVGRYIKNIESIGDGESVCIKVDAEDSLFVIEHGIVTHNTYMSTVAALESKAKKILIVCPSSMKIGWQREIESFGQETSIISGKEWNPAKFTIINFDILKNFHTPKSDRTKEFIEKGNIIKNHIIEEEFDLVIVDEAHNLKNHKSIRGKIMDEICTYYGKPKVWLLTGTPVANRPMDFYNLLKLIGSPIVNNFHHFALRYCDGKKFWKTFKNGKKKQIWLTDGASNLEELALKTRNIILRRKKEDVLDMPEKTITPIYHELTAKETLNYDNLWEEYLLERKAKKKRGKIERDLVELGLLRQFIANQTISKTIEMVDNAIEQGNKVIIFTNFNEEQQIIADHYGKIGVRHNGSMNEVAKQSSVDRFQNDDNVKVFIGNIKSAGVGITLTAATVVVFNSLDWVPGNILQSIDRAYRIGQKNNVSVYFNIFKGTVDERVWKSLFEKSNIIETILNGNKDEANIFIEASEEDILKELDKLIDEDI